MWDLEEVGTLLPWAHLSPSLALSNANSIRAEAGVDAGTPGRRSHGVWLGGHCTRRGGIGIRLRGSPEALTVGHVIMFYYGLFNCCDAFDSVFFFKNPLLVIYQYFRLLVRETCISTVYTRTVNFWGKLGTR